MRRTGEDWCRVSGVWGPVSGWRGGGKGGVERTLRVVLTLRSAGGLLAARFYTRVSTTSRERE